MKKKSVLTKAVRFLKSAAGGGRASREQKGTAEQLRHFEELGLDAQFFKPYRAWELSDEECLELKAALDSRAEYTKKREQDVCEHISRKFGIDAEDVRRKYRLASEYGYEEFWFLADGIFMLSDDEIKARKNIRISEAEDEWQKEKKKRFAEIRKEVSERNHWSRAKYSLEQLKARNNCGCAADEFIQFRVWNRSPEEARKLLTAEIKHKAWLLNATTYESGMKLRNKIRFSEDLGEFVNRTVFPNRGLSFEDFEAKINGLEYIVYKPEEGDKGIGMEKLRVNESAQKNREIYEHLCCLEPGIVEEFLYQHPDIAAFYPGSVNTMRVITAIKNGEASVVIAALRTGRYGNTDNWSQGGISAGINVETGLIETDGADYHGERYKEHPVSGKTFKGAVIPEWDKVARCCCEAAKQCPDTPFVGWDAAVLKDSRVVLIEGNQSFGTKAIQTPYSLDDTGLRERFEQFL